MNPLSLLQRLKDKAFQAFSGAGNQLAQTFAPPAQVSRPIAQPTPQAPAIDWGKTLGDFLSAFNRPQVNALPQQTSINPSQLNASYQDAMQAQRYTPPEQLKTVDALFPKWTQNFADYVNPMGYFNPKPENVDPLGAPRNNLMGDVANMVMSGRGAPEIPSGLPKQALSTGSKVLEDIAQSPAAKAALAEAGHIKLGFSPAETVQQVLGRATANILPEVTNRYLAKAGSNVANFIADEAGNVSKVIKGGKKTKELFKNLETTVLPSSGEVAGALPSGERLALPSGVNPVATEINNIGQQFKNTVNQIPQTAKKAKGLFKRTVNAIAGNWDLTGARGVVAKDSPAGKAIVEMEQAAQDKSAQLAGQAHSDLRETLTALNQDEASTLSDAIEGKIAPISDAQANAVNMWKKIREDIYTLATQTGMKIGKIENYFPHFIVNKDGTVALDEGSFISRGANLDYGNLVKHRLSDAPYEKNPDVLYQYITHAYDNIVKRAYFGKGDQNLYNLADKSANPGQVKGFIDDVLGKGNKGGIANEVANGITSLQTASKMGFMSVLTNLTQQISAAGRTDLPSSIAAVKQMITNPEQSILNAIKAGQIDPATGMKFIQKMKSAGDRSAGGKWLDFIKFNFAERQNRVFSVNAGREYATKLARQAASGSKAAIRELERLGVNTKDIVNGKLSESSLTKAGRAISHETQFSTAPGGVPSSWDSPLGRVLTQFKPFAYKQTGFVKEQAKRIGKEMAQGNFKPLASALAAYGVGSTMEGEIINYVKSVVTNKKRKDEAGIQRLASDIITGSSLGMLDNLEGATGQYGAAGFASFWGGPSTGDVINTAQNIMQARDPKNPSLSGLERQVVSAIPGVGKGLANTFVPNAAVNNLYGGTNNGLTITDKQTYDQMKEVDPAAAERFRADNQYTDQKAAEASAGGNWWDALMGKKTTAALQKPTNKKEQTAYNQSVDEMLANGANIPDEYIKQRFFNGKDYSSKDISDRKDILEAMNKVQKDEYLTDEQKTQIAKSAGISPQDWQYYQMASMDAPEKLQGILSFAQTDSTDRNQFITSLLQNKKMVGGKAIMNDDMTNALYDQGLISKDEKALMNAVKWDQVNEKFYVDRDYQAKYGEGGTAGQLSASKRRAYISKLNTIYKSPFKQTKVAQTKITQPKAPTLRFPKRVGGKTKSQWFNSY